LFELREAAMPWTRLSPDYNGYSQDLYWLPTDKMMADEMTKNFPNGGVLLMAFKNNLLLNLDGCSPARVPICDHPVEFSPAHYI
jgi:hypothetical protein